MARRRPISPRKTPTQERARATLEQIVEAAAQVFERRGYAGATTNHIARRAGVSVGSLYQYFPNKQAILVVLVERHIERGVQRFWEVLARTDIARDPLDEVLRRFVDAMIELHTDRPALQRVLLEQAPQPPRVRAALREQKRRIVAAIAALLRSRPDVAVADPSAAAFLVAEAVQALTHELVAEPPDEVSPSAFADELVAMLVRYLSRA